MGHKFEKGFQPIKPLKVEGNLKNGRQVIPRRSERHLVRNEEKSNLRGRRGVRMEEAAAETLLNW